MNGGWQNVDPRLRNGTGDPQEGKLYGTTWSGGGYAGGAVFALDLSTGAEATVYGFCSQQICAGTCKVQGGWTALP